MHGSGLKIVLDPSFWTALDEGDFPVIRYVSNISTPDMALPHDKSALSYPTQLNYPQILKTKPGVDAPD